MSHLYTKDHLIYLYEELISDWCYTGRGIKIEESNVTHIEYLFAQINYCKYAIEKRRKQYCKKKKKEVDWE